MLKTVHMAGKQYGGVNTILHTLLQTPTSMLLHRTTKNSHTIVRIIPAQELYLTIPYLCPNIRPYILVTRESNQGKPVKSSKFSSENTDTFHSDKYSQNRVEVVSLANEHEDDGDKSTNAQ